MARPTNEPSNLVGTAYILGSAFFWSLYPFYFKATAAIPLWEMVAHRILGVVVWMLPLLLGIRFRTEVGLILRRPRQLLGLIVTGFLIGGNWIVYTYAVNAGHVMDTSLGYFLSPLFAVAMGVAFMGERLRFWQSVSIGIAALAVASYTVWLGKLPIVALALPLLFGIYGAIRKQLAAGPAAGLFVECLVVLPVGLGWFAWHGFTGGLAFPTGDLVVDGLTLGAGLTTIAPLFLFNAGARRLPFVTVGMLLYVAPSIVFVEAWLVFGEPLDTARLAAFVLIWLALAIYSLDAFTRSRRPA